MDVVAALGLPLKTLYIAFFFDQLTLDFFFFLFFFFYYSFSTVLYTANLLQQLIMVIKFPCKICNKPAAKNHHALQCDKCHIWVYIKCNKINLQTYKFLQKSPLAWYCVKCFEDMLKFLLELSPMRYSLKQTKQIESLQKTTSYLARNLSISSRRLWMTLHLQQFPASTLSPVSFNL